MIKRIAVALLVLSTSFFLGGCGTSSGEEHSGHGDGHNHDHGGFKEPREITDGTPEFDLAVEQNQAGDYVARLTLDGFEISPAGNRPDLPDGVYPGHAHLFIDRKMVRMIYEDEFILPPLEPGSHVISVMLSDPAHRPYLLDDELVRKTVEIEIPGSDSDA